MDGVTIVSHPLVQHKLTLLRKKDTLDQVVSRTPQGDRDAACATKSPAICRWPMSISRRRWRR